MTGVAAAPEAACAEARARPAASAGRPFLFLLGLVMAAGTFVSREPAPFDIAILLAGAVGLLAGAVAFSPAHRLLFILLGAYLVVNVACLAVVQDAQVAHGYLLITAYLATSCLFFVGFLNRYGDPAWTALLDGCAVSGVISSTASALAFWNVLPWQDELLLFGRPKGWFKDPNVFGPYLVVVLLYAVVRLQRPFTRWLASLAWIGVVACAALGVCLSFSRACWIGCAAALAAYGGIRLVQARRTRVVNRRSLYVLGFAAVALACILAVFFSNAATRRMLEIRLGQGGLQDYDAVRFYTHDRALAAGLHKPLGLGPGQSEVAFGYATHSMYLRVLSENGIPGFVLLYAVVLAGAGRALWAAFTCREPATADLYAFAAACMAGILVNGFVIDTIHWRHFWFVIALTWCSPRRRCGA